jgi:DNA-binding NarL/FixJ family response regulator
MSIRILIADDNASVRSAMRQVLHEPKGWEIIEAENGKEAVEKAKEFRPQLVILDLAMPVMDGLTAAREITKILPGITILLHTLYSSPQVELEAGKSGVLKIVPKSETSALVSAVQEALQSGLVSALPPEATSSGIAVVRRTEDRVRALCMMLLSTKDDQVLQATLVELRNALHEHVEGFRARLVEFPAVQERRVRNGIEGAGATMPETNKAGDVIALSNGKSEAEVNPKAKTSNG